MKSTVIRSLDSRFDPRSQAIFQSMESLSGDAYLIDWSSASLGSFHFNYLKRRINGRGFRNLLEILKFNAWSFNCLRTVRPDVVVAVDSETLPGAFGYKVLMWAKGASITLILDLADPLEQKIGGKFLQKFFRKIEGLAINLVDSVVYPSVNRIPAKEPRSFYVIENIFISHLESELLTSAPKHKGRIFYGGLLLKDRGLERLMNLIKDNQELEALICGYGELETFILLCSLEEPRIKYVGKADFSQICDFRAGSQFSWCWYDQSVVNNVKHASGKLLESFQVGSRPITNLPPRSWSKFLQAIATEAILIEDEDFDLSIHDFVCFDEGFKYTPNVLDTKTAYRALIESLYV